MHHHRNTKCTPHERPPKTKRVSRGKHMGVATSRATHWKPNTNKGKPYENTTYTWTVFSHGARAVSKQKCAQMIRHNTTCKTTTIHVYATHHDRKTTRNTNNKTNHNADKHSTWKDHLCSTPHWTILPNIHENTIYVAQHIEQSHLRFMKNKQSHLTFMKHTESVAHHIAQISHKQQWKTINLIRKAWKTQPHIKANEKPWT